MTLLRTPPGTKDVLPTEAAELRLIEDAVRSVFLEFGYGEVRTPLLEFEEVLALSEEEAFITGFRMLDEHGKVLVLRPDLTTPIARLVGSRLRSAVPPHRVFTIADVFRRLSPHRGRETEFRQAGVELLGSASPHADAEVLAIACRSLERSGLDGYRLGVGQVAFFSELLACVGLEPEVTRSLTRDLVAKDFVGFGLTVEKAALGENDRKALMEVPEMRGGAEVLDRAESHVRSAPMAAALGHLRATHAAVTDYGYGDRLLIDLGIFRNLDYYTGLVFEIYAPDVGFTLGGGGRYDNLLGRFGAAMPAVGFGLGLDRVHVALVEQEADLGPSEARAILVGGLDGFVALADRLRAEGVGVLALPLATAEDAAVGLARQEDVEVVTSPVPDSAGARWTVVHLPSAARETVAQEALVAAVVRVLFEASER